jgi:FtsH-binding integral membrane protein
MVMKPKLKYDYLLDPAKYNKYISNVYLYLACYLLLVIVVQFVVNSYVITSMCGGSVTENMGKAGFYTFIPWTFLYGVLLRIPLPIPLLDNSLPNTVRSVKTRIKHLYNPISG